MSPLQVLVLPDALNSRSQGRIRPGWPVVGSGAASSKSDGNSPSPFFFFSLQLSPICWNSLPHKLAPRAPLSYSPPAVHSVTVCFTLDQPPSHSLSATSIIHLSSIAVSFSSAAFPSPVNSSFSQPRPTLCPFTGSSLCSLTPPRLPLFISFPLPHPIIFPFNSPRTLFSFGSAHCLNLDEHVSLHPPPSFFPSASLSLHLHTVPSVFAKHWEAENHHSVNLLLLHESAATFRCPQNCRRKHKVVEP